MNTKSGSKLNETIDLFERTWLSIGILQVNCRSSESIIEEKLHYFLIDS